MRFSYIIILLLCTFVFAEVVKCPSGANPYAMRVLVSGNRLYSATGTGVVVWDITDPKNPKKVTQIPSFLACDVAVKNNLVFIASLYNGVRIVRIGDQNKPETLATLPLTARRIALRENLLFVVEGEEGKANLKIYDVSNPAEPKALGEASWTGIPYGIALKKDFCFIADDKRGLLIFPVSLNGKPKEVEFPKGYEMGQNAYDCEPLGEDKMIISRGAGSSLQLASFENGRITRVDSLPLEGYSCKGKDNLLFIAGRKGMTVADISQPGKAKVIGEFEFPGNAFDIDLSGDIAFIANGAFGVRVIDISKPSEPKQITLLDIGGTSFERAQSLPIKEQVGKASWLKVKQNKIVDEKGEPYKLVALGYPMVNFMWCEPRIQYRFGDIGGICSYLRSLGVNAIRLAFNPPQTDYAVSNVPSPAGRYPTPEEFVERELAPLVERFERGGLYVILDFHGAGDYPTLFGWALRAWRAIAQRFRNDPYIAWYELWQEPYFYPKEAKEQGLSPAEIRKKHIPGQRLYYLDAIREIRKWDKRHIVMVEDYGPWWRVAEEQWGPINFQVDPGFDNALFAKRAAYDNGFSQGFKEYVEGLMDKWQVPFCLAEIETGGRYNKPEEWYYFIYGWMANEERIPLQFWAIGDVEDMMADLWAPFAKQWASPPPPRKIFPEERVEERIVLEKNAEGGKGIKIEERGKQVIAHYLPPDAPVGSSYRFRLPKPLPIGKYRIRVKLYSDGKPAFPQAIVYRDERGWQYPPDSVLGSWGEDHFYYANHHIIPVYLYTKGWVEWETIWEPLANISTIEVRKVKGVPYLNDCERPELSTRPIYQIIVERLSELKNR
ncbi:MAG: cellulase family glycosylhydrolase [bacterium]